MKKVKLQVIGIPDKSAIRTKLRTYRLFLDWGLTASFRSKRKAVAFENRLNAWINDQVFILNQHFITCFTAYRGVWLYMDRERTEEKRINKLFDNINIWLNQLVELPGKGPDQAFRLLERITGIIEALIKIYSILSEVERRRNNWDNIKIYKYHAERLLIMEKELKNYSDPASMGGEVI